MSNPSSDSDGRQRHPSSARAVHHEFAHPSETLFASLLDIYGIEWTYEPVEFPLEWGEDGIPVRGFRPDFYLPRFQTFIELTVAEQRLVTKKNSKIRSFRKLYPEATLLVVYQKDFREILLRHSLDDESIVAA